MPQNLKPATIISLVNGFALLGLTGAEYTGILSFEMPFSYAWHKLLHVSGVVMCVGNMIAGPVWFSYAYYSKDLKLLKFAGKLLQITDLWITIPGMTITVINGLYLSSVYGGTKNQPWLHYSIVLLILMWIITLPLIYLQEKMYRLIDENPVDQKKIDKHIIVWSITGVAVMIPVCIIFYLMVFKTV